MDIQYASILVAGISAILTVVWFLVVAAFNTPKNDFFHGEGKLNSANVRVNLAATATSLAGALFFFMEQISIFAFVMAFVPIVTVFGYWVFLKIVGDAKIDSRNFGSIRRLIYWKTKSKNLADTANYFVILNFFAVFLIEIIIGAKVFSYLVGPDPAFLILFSAGLCLIVLYYVVKGGFSAVVFTDGWQFRLLLLSYLLTSFTIIILFFISHPIVKVLDVVALFNPANSPVGYGLLIMFGINALVVNSTLPASQISTWQRHNSAKSQEEATKGVWQGIRSVLGLWYLAIITSAFVYVFTGGTSGFEGMFDALRGGGLLPALIVFPTIFSGLLAALLSTADSFMISTMLATDDLKSHPGEELSSSRQKTMITTGVALTVVAVVGASVVAYSENIGQVIVSLLFAAYGIPCILFSLIRIGGLTDISYRLNEKGAVFSLLLGLTILISTAYFGIFHQNMAATFLGPVAAIIVAAIGIHISFGFGENKNVV